MAESTSPQQRMHLVEEGGALLLTRDEVCILTGSTQPARQRQWLDRHGWPYVNANGRGSYPRVARAVFVDRMAHRLPAESAPKPRLDALERLDDFT
ncbi:DUF4224 domain-containing protein [Piscinibacter sakaiensis]|uniref:DUF4224 domain-containing protein n=1 Tax=Piscinibacter sakaiensis TaxID=1547922 RepID=UPI003AAB0424